MAQSSRRDHNHVSSFSQFDKRLMLYAAVTAALAFHGPLPATWTTAINMHHIEGMVHPELIQTTDTFGVVPVGQTYGIGEPVKGYRVATQPTAADKFRFDSSRPEVYGVGEPIKGYRVATQPTAATSSGLIAHGQRSTAWASR